MVYVKAVQSYDTQIENLEIKSEKTLALLFVSFLMIFPIAIVYHAIGFNPYVAQLIPLSLELYFILAGYVFFSLITYQSILEICREFLLAKELFIRATRRHGIKKGASSLIKIFVERRDNKSRSNTQNKPYQPKRISPENVLDKEIDKHPFVTKVVNNCLSEENKGRETFIHEDDSYNRLGRANINQIIEKLNNESSSYAQMTTRRKHTLVVERLPEHMK